MSGRLLRVGALLLAAAATDACSERVSGPSPTQSSLTVTAAVPASGNGSLANVTITSAPSGFGPLGVMPVTDVHLTGSVGQVKHSVHFLVSTSADTLIGVYHTWGTDLDNPGGAATCEINGDWNWDVAYCGAGANVSRTDSSLVLNAFALLPWLGGTTTSTLTGVVLW